MKNLLIAVFLFFSFSAYSQVTETEITSLVNVEKLTLSGLLMLACWFFYKDGQQNKSELKQIREEKDKQIQELNNKMYEYTVKQTEMFTEFKQVVLENTKTLESYGRLLEKVSDKISG